jgi:putative Holliday junction resolvase
MRFLGIDPGGKRLGLALGDDVTGLATPLEVVRYLGCDNAANLIVEAMEKYAADVVVIGLPTSSDGSQTPGCARSHALARVLSELGVKTAFQSEYLTTDEARRRARSTGRRSGQPVDDIAAQVILEEYLEGRPPQDAPR